MIPYMMTPPQQLFEDLPRHIAPGIAQAAWQAGVLDGLHEQPPYTLPVDGEQLQPLYDHGYGQGSISKQLNDGLEKRPGAHAVHHVPVKRALIQWAVAVTSTVAFQAAFGIVMGFFVWWLVAVLIAGVSPW